MGTVFTEELKLGPVKSNRFILRRGGAEEKIPLVWLVMCFGFVIVFGRLEIGFGNQLLHTLMSKSGPFPFACGVCSDWTFFLGAAFLALGVVSIGDAMACNREMYKLIRRNQL